MTYDAAGRATAVADLKSDNSVISRFTYTYDDAGNRTRVVETDGTRVTWTYDATYQLLSEHRGGGHRHTFTYDPVGNRLTKDDGTAVTTYAYDDANRLETAEDGSGVTTHTFDATGNARSVEEPSGDLTTYTWTYENQMSAAEDAAGDVTTYTYAPVTRKSDELRVQKETDTQVTNYLWDGENLLRETDDLGAVDAEYTLAPQPYGDLISQRRDAASSFYHYDALGSTRSLTDSSEVETDDYAYEAFGKVASSTGSTTNPFQWVGEKGYYADEETSLYSLRRRQYGSGEGRFVSEDPARDDANLYRYVGNNSPTNIDPSGLQAADEADPAQALSEDSDWVQQAAAEALAQYGSVDTDVRDNLTEQLRQLLPIFVQVNRNPNAAKPELVESDGIRRLKERYRIAYQHAREGVRAAIENDPTFDVTFEVVYALPTIPDPFDPYGFAAERDPTKIFQIQQQAPAILMVEERNLADLVFAEVDEYLRDALLTPQIVTFMFATHLVAFDLRAGEVVDYSTESFEFGAVRGRERSWHSRAFGDTILDKWAFEAGQFLAHDPTDFGGEGSPARNAWHRFLKPVIWDGPAFFLSGDAFSIETWEGIVDALANPKRLLESIESEYNENPNKFLAKTLSPGLFAPLAAIGRARFLSKFGRPRSGRGTARGQHALPELHAPVTNSRTLTFRHRLKPNKTTDVAALRQEIQLHVDAWNEIIRKEGMQGLKRRLRQYEQYRPQIEAAGRRHTKSLGSAGEGNVWPHYPDMAAGGRPKSTVGLPGEERLNSIIGGQANRLRREILDLPDDVTQLRFDLDLQ